MYYITSTFKVIILVYFFRTNVYNLRIKLETGRMSWLLRSFFSPRACYNEVEFLNN